MTSLAKTLYDLANIMNCIEENEGEIPKYLIPSLQKTELDLTNKVDEYVGFHDAVTAQIEHTRGLIEKFKHTLTSLEAIEKRLKENAKYLMREHDLIEIKGQYRKIRLVNSGGPEALKKPEDMFYEVKGVSDKYVQYLEDIVEKKTVYVLKNKAAFEQAIKDGMVPNCEVVPRSKFVRFV
jgi:hypothetical protein